MRATLLTVKEVESGEVTQPSERHGYVQLLVNSEALWSVVNELEPSWPSATLSQGILTLDTLTESTQFQTSVPRTESHWILKSPVKVYQAKKNNNVSPSGDIPWSHATHKSNLTV